MREHSVNELNNFIMGWYTEENDLCDNIVEYHKNFPIKKPGSIGTSKTFDLIVNKEFKDSIDVALNDINLNPEYCALLQKCCNEYISKYPWSNNYAPWRIMDDINIQHYLPGGGYKMWHTERTDTSPKNCYRHLVYMTYLNDVTDEGETEFFHQGIKVKPEKGLTLIWPADWTFTHRGITSPTQEKYIVTGWFQFI